MVEVTDEIYSERLVFVNFVTERFSVLNLQYEYILTLGILYSRMVLVP